MFEKYVKELRALLTRQAELTEALLVIVGDIRERLDRAPALDERDPMVGMVGTGDMEDPR